MAVLVCDGRVVASAEVARSRAARRRGLLGRDRHDGALVLPRCRSVHTVGMRFPIDVVWLDGAERVVRVRRVVPGRIAWRVLRARSVVEVGAGAAAAESRRPSGRVA